MAQIKIEAILVDKGVTDTLNKISSKVAEINGKTQQTPSGWQSTAVAITAANAALAVFNAALGAAQVVMGKVAGLAGDVFMGAADRQSELFTAVNNLRVTGQISMDKADSLYRETMASLSEVAAPLSQSTDDFLAIFEGVSDNLAANFDLATAEGSTQFREAAEKISVLGGLLEGDVRNKTQFLNNYLGGRSVAELRGMSTALENAGLLPLIERFYEETGIEWANATEAQRIAALEFASAELFPPEVLAQMGRSVNGMIEAFKDSISNPQTGILGWARKIKDANRGIDRSVDDAVVDMWDSILGQNGIIAAIGDMLSAAGFDNDDVIRIVRDGVDKLTAWLRQVADAFRGIIPDSPVTSEALSFGEKFRNFIAMLDSAFDNMPALDLSGLINGLINFLFPPGSSISGAGSSAIEQGFTGWLQRSLEATLTNIDWGALGRGIIDWLMSGVQAQPSLDMTGLFELTLVGIGEAIDLTPMFNAIRDKLVEFEQAIIDGWNNILNTVGTLMSNIGLKGTEVFNALLSAITGGWSGWVSIVVSIGAQVVGKIRELGNALLNMVNRGLDAVANASHRPEAPSRNRTVMNRRASGTPNWMDAIRSEVMASPVGALPVIANTSELILNTAQQASLSHVLHMAKSAMALPRLPELSGTAREPRSIAQPAMSMSFSPTIYISQAGSNQPPITEEMVVRMLEDGYQRFINRHRFNMGT